VLRLIEVTGSLSTIDEINDQVSYIVKSLNGILFVNPLYKACRNKHELIVSYDNIVNKPNDIITYGNINMDEWVETIRSSEDYPKISGEKTSVTISDLLSY
jgi:hypothetical protein